MLLEGVAAAAEVGRSEVDDMSEPAVELVLTSSLVVIMASASPLPRSSDCLRSVLFTSPTSLSPEPPTAEDETQDGEEAESAGVEEREEEAEDCARDGAVIKRVGGEETEPGEGVPALVGATFFSSRR